jgi:hypothetical protein
VSQVSPDYFDVLPWHPRPQPFESLTGYLTRLAQGNGLQSIQGVVVACFPGQLERKSAHIPEDYPMASWGDLPTAAACPETILRATTFYHLAEKFGRSAQYQSMGLFLYSSLAHHFRYCPYCLAERGYYALPWRFSTLIGCVEHSCRLLDRCGHCGQPMPVLMKPPLRVGICSHCRRDLRLCPAEPLSEAEREKAAERLLDLQFLLSPGPIPEPDAAKGLGRRLVYWRLKRGLATSDLVHPAHLPMLAIRALEYSRKSSKGNFGNYVAYVDRLGLSLRDFFDTPLPPDNAEQVRRAKREARQQREQELLEQVRAVIADLAADGEPVTQKAISRRMGWSSKGLRTYPRVEAILEQVVAEGVRLRQEQAARREQALFEEVEAAIERLAAADQPVTQVAITQVVGRMTTARLLRYPRVRAIIEERATGCCQPGQRHSLKREDELGEAVQSAIHQLKTEEQAVTQVAVARVVGISVRSLQWYPRIGTILKQVARDNYRPPRKVNQVREQALLVRVQEAVRQLEGRNCLIVQKEIAELAGTPLSTLRTYPAVRLFLTEVAQRQRAFRAVKTQRREEEFLAKMQQAVPILKESGRPLTQRMLAAAVALSPAGLRGYPRVNALVDQLTRNQRRGAE